MKTQGECTRGDRQTPMRARLADLPPGEGLSAHAGALLRAAASPPLPDAAALAKVGARLHRSDRRLGRPLRLQVALTVALMLMSGVLSAGITLAIKSGSTAPSPAAKADPVVAPGKPAVRRPVQHPAKDIEASPPLTPPPPAALAPVPKPRPVRPLALRDVSMAKAEERSAPQLEPPPIPQTLPGPSALARESRLVKEAIAHLREARDAAAALRTLDAHQREFGDRGVLGPEANATRAQALIQLGRHAQALALLDGLPSAGVNRGLLIARADLRAAKGRLSSALADYDRLLSTDTRDDATERALMGRAACRGMQGDFAGARDDLQTYLARFPDGQFADKARGGLERARP